MYFLKLGGFFFLFFFIEGLMAPGPIWPLDVPCMFLLTQMVCIRRKIDHLQRDAQGLVKVTQFKPFASPFTSVHQNIQKESFKPKEGN